MPNCIGIAIRRKFIPGSTGDYKPIDISAIGGKNLNDGEVSDQY